MESCGNMRSINLEAIDERREEAQLRAAVYQRRAKAAYELLRKGFGVENS